MASDKLNFSNRVYALLIVFLVGLFAFWGFRAYEIWNTAQGNYPREILFEGLGISYVKPDLATINISVNTEGKTSEEVVEENNKKMSAVLESIKKLGVEEKDIQTTAYSLYPRYQWTQERGSFQDGYTMEQTLNVKLRDFDKINGVLAGATSSGANVLGGVNFTVEDEEVYKTEARDKAIAIANEKAKRITSQTGLKLGKLVNYYEWTDYYGAKSSYSSSLDMARAESDMGLGAGPSIEPGQEEIRLNVSLTYRIK